MLPQEIQFLPSPVGWFTMLKLGQLESIYGEPLGGAGIGDVPAGEYNIKIGPAKFRISMSGGITFSDNVNLSTNGKSDTILRAALGINGTWTMSDFNTLELAIRTSYNKYLNSPELDGVEITILPGTETGYDQLKFYMEIDDLTLTFYDRINMITDAFMEPALTGLENLRAFRISLVCTLFT